MSLSMHHWCPVGYLPLNLQQRAHSLVGQDDAFHLAVDDESARAVLVRQTDGALLDEARPASEDRRTPSLLHVLRKLVNARYIHVAFHTVSSTYATAQVRVDVHLHTSQWERQTWKKNTAAAFLFARLVPLNDDQGRSPVSEGLTPEQFSMASCFSELRLPSRDPLLPEVHYAGTSLLQLPVDVLTNVVHQLAYQDACSFSVASRFCRELCREATPGLKLQLYPHQRAARRWMLWREDATGLVQHPTWRRFVTPDGLAVYLCTATGSCDAGDITTEEPPELPDMRGGLFCDEPGLGKTITALSLILSTRGVRPKPLPGTAAQTVTDRKGRQACYYLADPESKPAVHAAAIGSSRRSGRDSQPVRRFEAEAGTTKAARPKHAASSGPTTRSRHGSSSALAGQPVADPAAHKEQSSTAGAVPGPPQAPADAAVKAGSLRQHAAVEGEGNGPKTKRQKQDEPGDVVESKVLGLGKLECQKEKVAWTSWVQCNICNKWRSLPQEPLEDTWFCTMHPDAALREKGCKAPQEKVPGDSQYTECSGYVDHPSKLGAPENVTYFANLARRHLGSLECRRQVLRWLGSLTYAELLAGIKMPTRKVRVTAADHVPALLAELELTPFNAENKRTSPGKAVAWQQSQALALLHLDTRAATEAVRLCTKDAPGPELGQRRVYLSPATLLVVPGTLIGHWEEQMRMHIAEGALRVKVLDRAADGRESTAMEVAWHCDLVITTFQRLSVEWSNGRIKAKSIFNQVHWLRVILDEGHMLGASLAMTNKLSMAINLKAERRWIMTGTPTPSTPTSHVAHLQPLLSFLGQQPYGTQRNFWEVAVQRPFEARLPEARQRLMALLQHAAIRASKDDLAAMVKRTHKVARVDFAPQHALSYNELIGLVKFNILTSDWGDEDHAESILSEKRSQWSSQMFKNIRLSCCVAGVCNIAVKELDVKETLEFLADRHLHATVDANEPPWLPFEHPLSRIESAMRGGCGCQVCAAYARTPLVTPCGHLVCTDCAAPHRTKCPVCREPYLMQAVDHPERARYNRNPKWEVPLELIEWQPSFTQQGATGLSGGEWSASWQDTRSSKVIYLLKRLGKIGAVPPKQPHDMDDEQWRQLVSAGPPLTKAIVFSSLWQHARLIAQQLLEHGVTFAEFRSNMTPAEKADSLRLFKEDPQHSVLLMDESGSVGLDLSFASHVFIMEPLENASLEEQVISRAHRMGARADVQVETLVMRGTVEEKVLELRELQRRPAAGQQAGPQSPRATAMDAQPGALQVVAQQGGKRGASTVREEHNAMMRSLLAIKVADLREPDAQRV